jgi:hypothetical protein
VQLLLAALRLALRLLAGNSKEISWKLLSSCVKLGNCIALTAAIGGGSFDSVAGIRLPVRNAELAQLQLLLLTVAVKTRCHEQQVPGSSSSSSSSRRRQQQQQLSLDVSRHRNLLQMLQELGLSDPQAAVAPWPAAVAAAVRPSCRTELFTENVLHFRSSSTVMLQYLQDPSAEHMVAWLGTVAQWEQANDVDNDELFAKYSEALRIAQPGVLMLLEAAHNLHRVDAAFAASAADAALPCTLSMMLRSRAMRNSRHISMSHSDSDGPGDCDSGSIGASDVTAAAAAAAAAAGEGAASAGGSVSLLRAPYSQPDPALDVAQLVKLVSGMRCRVSQAECVMLHSSNVLSCFTR